MRHSIETVAKPDESGLVLSEELMASARGYAAVSKAERTKRIYAAAWRGFTTWCVELGLGSLPASPATVALFLTARANEGRKVATLSLELVAISQAHKAAGHAPPRSSAEVQTVLRGIRRSKGVVQTKKAPVLVPELRKMVAGLPATTIGLRDRALLIMGFAGAFRRSEFDRVGGRRRGLRVRWPGGDGAALEDRSGGGRPESWYSLR